MLKHSRFEFQIRNSDSTLRGFGGFRPLPDSRQNYFFWHPPIVTGSRPNDPANLSLTPTNVWPTIPQTPIPLFLIGQFLCPASRKLQPNNYCAIKAIISSATADAQETTGEQTLTVATN